MFTSGKSKTTVSLNIARVPGIGGDWGDNADMQALCQVWYSTTLKNYAKQADLIGETAEAKWATAAAKKLDETFRNKFWTGSAYRHDTYKGLTDDRTQSVAVISGIATKDQYPKLLEIFKTTEFASPYMERYVLQAMCEMGNTQDAVDRMLKKIQAHGRQSPYHTLGVVPTFTGKL